jgi:hypothetical protein
MPLPELVAGQTKEEVSIRFGDVDHSPLETSEKDEACFSLAPEEVILSWQGIGSFLVREGHEIIVDPSPEVDERVLRLIVLGPALAALLRQRGHLLLHASAVEIAGEAVLFLGSAGWGKSTTAAALHARGHSLIADDLTALRVEQSRPIVLPGFPQLKLWPEAVASLGGNPEKLAKWNPYFEKRIHPAEHKFSSAPLPVKRIYVLDEGDAMEILPLQPQEAFVELVRHSYGSDYGLQTATDIESASHFLECASIVKKVPARSLRREKSLFQLSKLAQLIEKDLA